MVLSLDSSTPAIATQNTGAVLTVTTASFSPGLLPFLALWGGNGSTSDPTTPGIADGMTPDLVYTQTDWRHFSETPASHAQAAGWSTQGNGQSGTVTVTTGAPSPQGHAALYCPVFQGADTSSFVGAHGEGSSLTSSASVAISYTGVRTGGWGWAFVSDWNATGNMSAGSGTTLVGTGTLGATDWSYGIFRRTNPDDVQSSTNTINVNFAANSADYCWIYVSVNPSLAVASASYVASGFHPGAGPTNARFYVPRKYDEIANQTFTQQFDGLLVPSGGLTNRVGKPLAGSTAPAGALTKQVNKPLAGSSTPTGVLARQARKPLAGVVAPAGTLSRTAGKPLSGAISPSGSLATVVTRIKALAGSLSLSGVVTKQVNKNGLAGVLSSSGVLTRQANKGLSGSISPSATLANVRAILRSFAGSISPTGALTKQVQKPLAGVLSPSGGLTKQVNKPLAGSISLSATLTNLKTLLKSFGGSISPTGALTKRIGKPVGGSLSPSGILTKLIGKNLAGTITSSGSLAAVKTILRSFAGALSPSGTLSRQTQKPIAGVLSPSGALTRRASKSLSGSVTPAGALLVNKAILRAFAGTINLSGSLVRQAGKALGGSVNLSGLLTRRTNKTLGGTVIVQGNVTKRTSKSFAGAVLLTGVVGNILASQLRNLVVRLGRPITKWSGVVMAEPKWKGRGPLSKWSFGLLSRKWEDDGPSNKWSKGNPES